MPPYGFTPRSPFAYKIPSRRSPSQVIRARKPRNGAQETVEETGKPRPRGIRRFRHFLVKIIYVLRHWRWRRGRDRSTRPLITSLRRPSSGATRPVSGAQPPLQMTFGKMINFVVHMVVGMAPHPQYCDSPTLFPQLVWRPPNQPVSHRIRVQTSSTRCCARSVLIVNPENKKTPLGRISMNHQPAQNF